MSVSGGASPSRAISSTSATPSASPSAVSNESVSRRSRPSRSTSRSTTTSILCCSYRAKRSSRLQELVDLHRLAVDPGAHVALAGQILEQRVVLALAATNDRRQHLEAGALGELQDAIDDLLRGLALQLGPVVRAVLHADSRVEQTEVVVDLGDRADGRAGVPAGRLLIDRDRRRQTLDHVDVGLVHLAEELTGVGRQGLDVAPLSLGVDRVERETGLARPRDAGEHDQLVARQFDVDVLQVVFAGTSDDDRGLIGEARSLSGGHCPRRLSPNVCSVW